MQIRRIELFSPFRSLHKGFSISFSPTQPDERNIAPICLVGVNGSGKSNVMELLCEIFYYLETLHLDYDDSVTELLKGVGLANNLKFELEYTLTIPNQGEKHVWVVKKSDKTPVFYLIDPNTGEKQVLLKGTRREQKELIRTYLPNKIIGYSSGQNELISNPFWKMQFHYYRQYIAQLQDKDYQPIDLTRLFYMNYQTNELVVLANFLLQSDKLHSLQDLIKVKDLDSFRIEIELGNPIPSAKTEEMEQELGSSAGTEEEVDLLNPFQDTIDKLKKCATLYYEEIVDAKTRTTYRRFTDSMVATADLETVGNERSLRLLTLDFKVTETTKEAFQYHFGSASALFNELYGLTLLNTYKLSDEQIEQVCKADRDFNISDYLPKLAGNELLFHVCDLHLTKSDTNSVIPYMGLSDGEHQFMHIIGTVLLMNEPGNLFILDEPETHFNPNWRSKLVSTLNEITKPLVSQHNVESKVLDNQRHQFFVLTTHSPFVVTDCHNRNVFKFSRDSGRVSWQHLEQETYGASWEEILNEVFEKRDSISVMAQEEIDAIYDMKFDSPEPIREIENQLYRIRTKYGSSIEKSYLEEYLIRTKRNLESQFQDA